MRIKGLLCAAACWSVLFAVGTAASANSENCYANATFDGIYIDKVINADHSVAYTLNVGKDAKFSTDNGASWRGITEVQGFYILSKDDDERFSATGNSFDSWNWVASPTKYCNTSGGFNLAGWAGNDHDSRLNPGSSKTFTFNTLNLGGIDTLFGLHVGYGSKTASFKGVLGPKPPSTPAPVPEPSSILAASTVLGPAILAFRRRKIAK